MAKDFRRLVSARSRRMFMTDVRDLVEGQQVQIWSESQQSWAHGEVVQKVDHEAKGIVVRVGYGDPPREKWLDPAMVTSIARKSSQSKFDRPRKWTLTFGICTSNSEG